MSHPKGVTAITLDEFLTRKYGAVYRSLEAFLSMELEIRREAFRSLTDMDAHRRSPLVAAILGRSIREPDLSLRLKIVSALHEVYQPDSRGRLASPRVRHWLRSSLSQMRTREIYALLQVVANVEEAKTAACRLLSECSFSGETLLDMLRDRKVKLSIRAAAVEALMEMGYLDALPIVEELISRISGRSEGQLEMSFAPDRDIEAEILLPLLRRAKTVLAGDEY